MRPPPPIPAPLSLRRRRRWPWRRAAVATATSAALTVAVWLGWRYHGPRAEVEIYRGVTYGCERLPATAEQRGLVHWVVADLTVPGVRLYTTPTDDGAERLGGEYRLRYTADAAAAEGLAVAVNGTFFRSDSAVVRRSGDLAWATETVVADHAVNHVDPNSYLLWWDDACVARLEATKPPSAESLRRARWGIGGQLTALVDGRPSPCCDLAVDARTMVAADPAGKRVYLACFDHASYRAAALFLAAKGATIGFTVDGGTSTAMALGDHPAAGVRGGTVTGNWRPVATVVGVRADAVLPPVSR